MIHYLDASLVVAIIASESASARAGEWIAAQAAGSLYSSGWVTTEVASALAKKLRTGEFTREQQALAAASYTRLVDRSFHHLSIDDRHLALAARMIERSASALSAGDALHLAIAAERNATIATLDIAQAMAGQDLGVATLLV